MCNIIKKLFKLCTLLSDELVERGKGKVGGPSLILFNGEHIANRMLTFPEFIGKWRIFILNFYLNPNSTFTIFKFFLLIMCFTEPDP